VIVVTPQNVSLDCEALKIERPFVKLVTLQVFNEETTKPSEAYPVVVKTPPVPICTLATPVPPAKDTPCIIRVIRFTHEGILVKSMLVPEVDDCAVAIVDGARVPVAATSVWVLVPATAGAAIVIVPDVEPFNTGLLANVT
jgi:hypothetical protein